jgi:hypothetical protein
LIHLQNDGPGFCSVHRRSLLWHRGKAIHGAGLAENGGTFRLAVNDNVGGTQFQDLTPSKSIDTSIHTFVLTVTSAGTSINLSLDGGTNVATLTSNLPTPSQGLGAGAYVETATAAPGPTSLPGGLIV